MSKILTLLFLGSDLKRSTGQPRFCVSRLRPKKVHWTPRYLISRIGPKKVHWTPRYLISRLGPKKVHWTFLVLYFYNIREELKFFWDVFFTIFFFQFIFGFEASCEFCAKFFKLCFWDSHDIR